MENYQDNSGQNGWEDNQGNGSQNGWENEQPRRSVVIVGKQEPENRRGSNLAVTSLVLGILALVFVILFYISFILALIGLIMGIVSLAQNRDGRGMAVAGTITSGIALAISFVIGFLWILAMTIAI